MSRYNPSKVGLRMSMGLTSGGYAHDENFALRRK